MIYLIITTSINSKFNTYNYEGRKNRYIESIQSALSLVTNYEIIKPIIVENNGPRNTFLNDFSCDIIYTNNNMIDVQHKGVTELLDIKQVITQYNISDDDVIIKLTGRYKILDDSFFNLVINNCNNRDAFVKFFDVCTFKYGKKYSVLGLIAVKCKYLKNFNYKCKESPETEIATHIIENIEKEKIMEIHNLGLECCFADDLRLLNV
jgi:hypothetical protein